VENSLWRAKFAFSGVGLQRHQYGASEFFSGGVGTHVNTTVSIVGVPRGERQQYIGVSYGVVCVPTPAIRFFANKKYIPNNLNLVYM
jgi:hypothetical protein